MTVPTDICNMSLSMIGAQASVQSINPSDGSAQANACATFYTPVTQMLLRAAHWNCARKQISLTQLKSIYVNGQLSPNPPPTPWYYEYAVPPDSLKMRFLLNLTPQSSIDPPLTTGGAQFPVPQALTGFSRFTPAVDLDPTGNPVKVILTNQCQAQGVYTADISQTPDLWDSQFLMAAATSLASYLVNTLARNTELMHDMVGAAKGAIDAARATDGNEALPTQDNIPDWIKTRMVGGGLFGGGWGAAAGVGCAGWDSMVFPGGMSW